MKIESTNSYEKISEELVKEFLSDIQNNFWNEERENKKYFKKILKENFWIIKIKKEDFEKIFLIINQDIDNFKFFEKENFLDYDITEIHSKIIKLNKESERIKQIEDHKIWKIEERLKNIVEKYLQSNIEDEQIKKILDTVKKYVWDFTIKDIEMKQLFVQEMWNHHILLPLVIKINDKLINVSIFKNTNTNKIVEYNITPADKYKEVWWEKRSTLAISKLYDNPESWIELKEENKLNLKKFNLTEEAEKTDSDIKKPKVNLDSSIRNKLNKNDENSEKKELENLKIFIEITKEWNKIFRKNKEDLAKAWNNQELKNKIIEENAWKIADLFMDNASLQWTMDFDNSHWDWIKNYFIHFLAKSPTMRFSKINKINILEDWLLYVQWDYKFEVDKADWTWSEKIYANFAFTFEKNEETGKWWIARLNSTFWKTEDNLKPEQKK